MQVFSPIITGSLDVTGSVSITGSLKVSSGITGSLLGTASYALNTTTFSGANNYIPKFSGSTNIINSIIYNTAALVGINTSSPGTTLDVNGTIRSNQYIYVGGGSNSEYAIEIGQSRTGNGYAYIDLTGDATYNDYGLRIIRGATGANTTSNISHRGTGTLTLETIEQGSISLNTNNTRRLLIDGTGSVSITAPALKIDIPSKGNGYILTSDTSGNATWQSGTGLGFPYSGSAIITGSLTMKMSKTEYIKLSSTQSAWTSQYFYTNANAAWFSNNLYLSSSGYWVYDKSDAAGSIFLLHTNGIAVYSTNAWGTSGNVANTNLLLSTDGNSTNIYNLVDGNTTRQPYIITTNLSNNALYYQNNPTASSIAQINTGSTEDVYIKPLELEQSKHTTINIYNFLNFS